MAGLAEVASTNGANHPLEPGMRSLSLETLVSE